MTIGIYTIHACNNFGALLQAYATAKFLNDQHKNAEVVNVTTPVEEKKMHYKFSWIKPKGLFLNVYSCINRAVHRKKDNFEHFRSLIPLSQRYFSYSEVIQNAPFYDIHLVGSDQVWNLESGMRDYYFLPFLPDNTKIISYASSFGNIEAAKKHTQKINTFLRKFASIGVREQDACDYINQDIGLIANCVLDPTFLLDSKQWEEIAGDERIIKNDYILYYGFDTNSSCANAIKFIRKELSLPVVGISVSLHSPFKFDIFYQEAGPKEFLNLIKNAKFILTSSFHGMALSIIFKKDFAVLKHGTRMSRMESLLKSFCLADRIVSNCDDLQELIYHKCIIDYNTINTIINKKVLESRAWLTEATELAQ